jgi:predicted amidohydrolase
VTTDCADIFCELFDGVAVAEYRANGEAWLADEELQAVASEVEAQALDETLDAGALRERVMLSGEREQGRLAFGVLRGLDAALAHANPAIAGAAPPALAEYALRYAETGRLDSGALPGALVPRFARPGRGGQLPDDFADAFPATVRVGAHEWAACDHYTLPAHARLSHVDRDAGLRIGTAPMIRAPDELLWEVHERGGLRFYRIHPADQPQTASRIERVVAAWDDQEVTIGIAPELSLSHELLGRWRSALRERGRAATSRLRLVLAGSGNVERATPPANTAVLLDAQTGEPLVLQRKIHPFNFSPEDLGLWGLEDRFTAPIDEDLSRGERVCVIDGGGVRVAILVCEDLARLHAFAGVLHAHGVSLILVPLFARPTKDRRWERARADAYCDATGSSVVAANSLVMAQILRSPAPVGTAIAVAGGGAAVGSASEPDDVVVFSLADGTPRVARERRRPQKAGQTTAASGAAIEAPGD